MLHGLGGQATNWTDLMGILRGRLHALAFDLPGFGWSPPPADRDYSLAGMARVATTVVERHASAVGRPVHLFGNSLGGAVAVRVATLRPDLVRSLVLTSPALPDLRPRRHTMGVPLVAVPGIGAQMWRVMAKVPPEQQVQAMLTMNFGDPARVSNTRRDEAIAEYRRRFALPYAGDALSKTARGLLRAFVETGQHSLWRQAAALQCPTLIFYGGKDRLVNPRRARRASQRIPRAQVVVLPRLGHVPQMEDPSVVARFVGTFLDGLPDD